MKNEIEQQNLFMDKMCNPICDQTTMDMERMIQHLKRKKITWRLNDQAQ